MADSENKKKQNNQVDDHRDNNSLYVVTENGEQCFMWRSNQLTYIAQDRHELPLVLATKFGPVATRLDLSYNSLTSFKNINLFINLNELILDNNDLDDDHLEFELNLRLKTLSLNKNRLKDLYRLINAIKNFYPNLEYLSLIGNPLCPGPLLRPYAGQVRSFKDLDDQKEKASSILIDSTKTILSGGIQIDELVLNEQLSNNDVQQINNGWTTKPKAFCEFSHRKYRHFVIYHLPNLRFLDSGPISATERDEALKRCFWMSQATLNQLNHNREEESLQAASLPDGQPGDSSQTVKIRSYDGNVNGLQDNGRQQIPCQRLPGHSSNQPKGVFSRLTFKYTGRNSEGNRFIRNQDL